MAEIRDFEKVAMPHLAAVRPGGFTYCAVGEVEQELLTEMLTRLVGD